MPSRRGSLSDMQIARFVQLDVNIKARCVAHITRRPSRCLFSQVLRSRGVHRLDEKGDVECEGGFQLLLHERALVRDGCDLDIGADERSRQPTR
jgi:hypothetical protein